MAPVDLALSTSMSICTLGLDFQSSSPDFHSTAFTPTVASMKRLGGRRANHPTNSVSTPPRLATNVETFKVTLHTDAARITQQRYVKSTGLSPEYRPPEEDSLPFPDAPLPAPEETPPGAIPAYESTPQSEEKAARIRKSVAHMNELKAQEDVFLRILLDHHHHPQLNTLCLCGGKKRTVACNDCLQGELLCRQCWLNKHRTMPTHWAFVWNKVEKFFEKYDFSRLLPNTSIGLGHNGERCSEAEAVRSFTLVDCNGIHATTIAFCGCRTVVDPETGKTTPVLHFQQLLKAGIFPGSAKDPKTGYTLVLLESYRQQRNQGKGSAYNFVLVLQRLADPWFAGEVPDIYINFLAITRFHDSLQIKMQRGHAHSVNIALPGQADRPYPNRPMGYLGLNCGACPERGVNMPLIVNVPKYLRHTISQNITLDGNFKANLFFKRDDGSDEALTDGNMYFPNQAEFKEIARTYVVPEADKEVPCKAHIGSIRHQGEVKYGNTALSGVVASACDHAVAGSLVDMLKGEAFAIGTYAQRELLRHTNSPPHGPATANPIVCSYDSWCSFVVNLVLRATTLFPEETWLHTLLAGTTWQAVYFACRAHFHGETAEMLWAFLNPLGSSTRQMTGAARHDIMNFVIDAWNTLKLLRQSELLAAERLDALRLFELHMAVVEDLSRQHATDVVDWSRMSRGTKKENGKLSSVYQHSETKVLTIESVLATMIAAEQEKLREKDAGEAETSVAQWIVDGLSIQRSQTLTIALLKSHREHPLADTWGSATKLRDTLNADLKRFRERQREIYPRLKLSALDVDEPELTAIQLPSYRMKHGHRPISNDPQDQDWQLQQAEIKLRCTEADNGILAVRAASLALSAVKKARDLDYRGQAGVTRSQRNLQKAELMKAFEITMYNNSRTALIHLGYMDKTAVEPYRDSRLFDGTAWYLQSGGDDFAHRTGLDTLLVGTQTRKRAGGARRNQRSPKRMRDIAPDDVEVESSASEVEGSDMEMLPSKRAKGKGKGKKADGWIWMESLMRRQFLSDKKLAAYKKESDRVQWFRAEAEMYRWLEQYERKHAELMRVIERFRRDGEVWAGLGDREETQNGAVNGAATFARMKAAMYRRLEHNAKIAFEDAESGAHHDWVSATSFNKLVVKIDEWREVVFKWMDDMDIYRAYKDF
ncbi:hypothetical protein C8F04DRAFT_1271246 [Mycena alexandri]|uniref:CxC2-like cysteine cluster KDZ transposase-associated domain-containing protein n=1 Tax=Mycena alexandri TaxID=1745969 RepID=A0AAD6WSD6_9AGAR|nr:hypothetical protein C8F04DRAFT_1271246 [Mycena alexandri]